MSYHSPTDLAAALRLAASARCTVIAGGTDVFPAQTQGRPPAQLLDVTQISELKQIAHHTDHTRIGAATSWSTLIGTNLAPAFDGLKQAAATVGSVQIQNAGTIAGNLCNASPAADGVPPLLTLDAQIELSSAARGPRTVDLSDFITGPRSITLEPDELVIAILVPHPPEAAQSAFEKLGSRAYLVISISMTAALVCCDSHGKITQARVAVGACSAVAQRLKSLETSLIGTAPQDITITPDHLAPLSPIGDVRGSAEYRLDVVGTQIKRAIMQAASQ